MSAKSHKTKGKQAAPQKRSRKDQEDSEHDVETAITPKQAKLDAESDPITSRDWINRQRTLVFCSRGVSYRARHLMLDLRTLMPHSKKEAKLDRKDLIKETIPEICELKNCNNALFFEMRKRQDLYMWASKMNTGPSAKFLVENVHTMSELKFSGNTLRGSRPILNFDKTFDSAPHFQLIKELFFQAFGTPRYHPKSKPFVDRVMSFHILDNRIWVRNFEVLWRAPGAKEESEEPTMVEIGPRFVLKPIRIFEGCFGGPTLYNNPDYVSPNLIRRQTKYNEQIASKARVVDKQKAMQRAVRNVLPPNPVDEVFRDSEKLVTAAKLRQDK